MKAVQLLAHGTPGKIELREIPDPVPGPDDAVIEVKACGLNHLDLWLEEAGLPIPLHLPRVPGGEVAGVILEVGRNVVNWHPGDRVAIQSNLFCGECEFCLTGNEPNCLNSVLLGVQRDGGFAEKIAVPVRSLVRLPNGLAFESSAALTLAASTAMHMLTSRAQVASGDWVLVMAGASGVGSAAIQIARELGAYVIASGSTPQKRELALELGAHHAIDLAHPDWPAEVRRLTQKRGVDLVIEHIGGKVLEQAFQCLARCGRIVTCGATSGREIRLPLWPFFVKQHELVGSYGRTRTDMEVTFTWASQGRLKPVIDSILPLDQAPAAFARLRSREALGKILVSPHGSGSS